MLETLTPGNHGKQNTNKLVNNGNHCFLITAELGELMIEIISKYLTPLNHPNSHLEQNIPQVRISLLGNTTLYPPLTRLLHNRIGTSILNDLLPVVKPFNISNLSNKSASKSNGNTRHRRNYFNLTREETLNLPDKRSTNFLSLSKEELQLFNVVNKSSFHTFIRDTYRGRSSSHNILSRERRISSLSFDDAISYTFNSSLRDLRRRREDLQYGEESGGKDIKIFLGFWEKDRKAVLNLSFTRSDLLFNFLQLSCKELHRRKGRIRKMLRNKFRLRSREDSDIESIFFIGFRRVVSRKELYETMDGFGINNRNRESFGRKEDSKRDMISSRRFEYHGTGRKRRDNRNKGRETLHTHWEGTLLENGFVLFNDTEIERVFRDVNSNVEHGKTSLSGFFDLSLISILPNGRSFKAQSTNWELRDRGTDSFRGFRAYVKWSPCPSFCSLTGNNFFYRKLH